MKQKTIWELLKISSTTNQKDIKTAYAKQAKLVHPEEHPEEFIQLNEAYRLAIQYAKAHKQDQTSTTPSQNNTTTIPLEAELDFSSLEHQSTVSSHKQKTEEETINVHEVLAKAKQKLEKQYEQQRTNTLHCMTNMLQNKRTSIQQWTSFFEEQPFSSISLDPIFLTELHNLLQTYDVIPMYANVSLTNYYENIHDPNVEESIDLILYELNRCNKTYETQKKQKKQKADYRFKLTMTAILALLLIACMILQSIILPLFGIFIAVFYIFIHYLEQYRHNQHTSNQRNLRYLLLLFGCFFIFTIIITIFISMDQSKQTDITKWAKEAYGEQVTYESTVELNESINYNIYTFYDQTNDFYFHIKETKHEEGYEFEDDYASSMVLSKNTASLIHSYKQYDPTSIYYDDSMIDGVSIQIIDHDIKASTTELYTFLQTIRALPEIQEVKDNVFIYVMPKGAYYRKWFQEAIPFSEALEMSEAQLYDWLAYCDTIYTLEYTFKEYDETDPYVKRYMSEAQGVDLMIQGTQVHVDGVKVMDGKLSIGSFYRLAKALDLDIEVTSETSLLWKIHGRIQLIGTGSADPYIEQSFIEEVLQP